MLKMEFGFALELLWLKNWKSKILTDYKGNSPFVYHKKHKVKYHTTNYVSKNRKVVIVNKKNNGKGHGKGKKD